MRNSGSFKNLIEARCKTPNKFESNPLIPGSILESKRENTPMLKESLSTNHLFKHFSKPRLSESRSFDKFKPFSQVSSSESSEIRCMNNDGKKVFLTKYRQSIESLMTREMSPTIYSCITVLNALFPWYSKAS